MTLSRGRQYEPPAPADFERVVLGIKWEPGSPDGTVAEFHVTANLVATNASLLKRLAAEALDAGCLDLVVVLDRCPYVDSAGCGALVSIANAWKRAGRRMVVVGANEDLRTLFDLTKLSTCFEVR